VHRGEEQPGEAWAWAGTLLKEDRARLNHVAGTAQITRFVSAQLSIPWAEDLLAAAWLHDIGYAPGLVNTGFHPLDGAAFLARGGWSARVVGLVAHHSHNAMIAPYFDAADALADIAAPDQLSHDILAFADIEAGRHGQESSGSDRLRDMRQRYQTSACVPRTVREDRYEELAASVEAVRAMLNRDPHVDVSIPPATVAPVSWDIDTTIGADLSLPVAGVGRTTEERHIPVQSGQGRYASNRRAASGLRFAYRPERPPLKMTGPF